MASLLGHEVTTAWSGARLKVLNEQTAALLNQLHPLAGVQEAVVYDNHGELLGAVVAAGPLERARYHQVGPYWAQVFAALEQRRGRPKEIEMRFPRRELLARDLGNAFVAIGCAPGVDWALLRLTLNVAAVRFEKDTALQESLRQVAASRLDVLSELKAVAAHPSAVSRPRALSAMAAFTDSMIEELGEHGFGRDNLLWVVEQRLLNLKVKYPWLKANVVNRKVDLSPLEATSATLEEIATAWLELIGDMYRAAVKNLGPSSVNIKYNQVYDKIYRQNEPVFQSLNLHSRLRQIQQPSSEY